MYCGEDIGKNGLGVMDAHLRRARPRVQGNDLEVGIVTQVLHRDRGVVAETPNPVHVWKHSRSPKQSQEPSLQHDFLSSHLVIVGGRVKDLHRDDFSVLAFLPICEHPAESAVAQRDDGTVLVEYGFVLLGDVDLGARLCLAEQREVDLVEVLIVAVDGVLENSVVMEVKE